MKIVYLIPEFKKCGPVNVVLNLIGSLSKSKDIELSIIVISIRGQVCGNAMANEFFNSGTNSIYTLSDYSNLISKVKFLRNILADADVVHSHCFYPDFLNALLNRNSTTRLTTVHCMLFKDYKLEYGWLKGILYASIHYSVLCFAFFNAIVCCSHSVKDYLSKLFFLRSSNLLVVRNGVNSEAYFPVGNKNKLRFEIFGSNFSDRLIFVYTGRLIRRKRVPELISWFIENILCSQPKAVLLILGDGEEYSQSKLIAKGHNNIIFLGLVDDVAPYYQLSDFFISYSSAEGLPMSALEAISCGCIAILSDIPSHRELVTCFPNSSILIEDYIDWDKQDIPDSVIHYASSERMAREYLVIYEGGKA